MTHFCTVCRRELRWQSVRMNLTECRQCRAWMRRNGEEWKLGRYVGAEVAKMLDKASTRYQS